MQFYPLIEGTIIVSNEMTDKQPPYFGQSEIVELGTGAHFLSVDEMLAASVFTGNVNVFTDSKEVFGPALQRAYSLYNVIGDDEAKAAYVINHRLVKGRIRLPSASKPALLCVNIALNPVNVDQQKTCSDLSCVLIVFKKRSVAISKFKDEFLATSVKACVREVRSDRAEAGQKSERPKRSGQSTAVIDSKGDVVQIPSWKVKADDPYLCLFRVDDGGATPLVIRFDGHAYSKFEAGKIHAPSLAAFVQELFKEYRDLNVEAEGSTLPIPMKEMSEFSQIQWGDEPKDSPSLNVAYGPRRRTRGTE